MTSASASASTPDSTRLIADLLDCAGLPAAAAHQAEVRGADPVFPTRLRVAQAGACSIAASALAAAHLHTLRGGAPQRLHIDAAMAAAAMRSNQYLRIDHAKPPRPTDKITGFYPVQGGRWIFMHSNFANLRARNLGVLGLPADSSTAEEVARETARWDGVELETHIHETGGCGAFVRSRDEWLALAQAQAVRIEPMLEVTRIGDAPPLPMPAADRPLAGVRVLDLTRVLAGPTCGRALAEQGAQVMRLSRADLPDSGMFDLDTGLGKLNAFLDLREPAGQQAMQDLLQSTDVFLQSYRPGALDARGLSPADLARIRPGMVYVTLDAWGFTSDWKQRRGYDTVVQAANGMAWREDGQKPQFLPVSAQDYIAGYLLALGATAALARRHTEGGSWQVRVSLARCGEWVYDQRLVPQDAMGAARTELEPEQLAGYLMDSASPVGLLTHLAPAAVMTGTPGRWDLPAVPLGTHAPRWP